MQIVCGKCATTFEIDRQLSYICPHCQAWICGRCHWTWKPRAENPRYCPNCKRSLLLTPEQIKDKQELYARRLARQRELKEKGLLSVTAEEPNMDQEFLCFVHYQNKTEVPAVVKIGKHHYCAECAHQALDDYLSTLGNTDI